MGVGEGGMHRALVQRQSKGSIACVRVLHAEALTRLGHTCMHELENEIAIDIVTAAVCNLAN